MEFLHEHPTDLEETQLNNWKRFKIRRFREPKMQCSKPGSRNFYCIFCFSAGSE